MKREFLYFASLLLIFSASSSNRTLATERKTSGVQAKWLSASMAKHLLSIEPAGDRFKISSDGQYLKSNEQAKTFFLSPGEKMEYRDRHFSVSLVLIGAKAKALQFKYEAKFDKRSFADDETTVDSGEVSIAVN